MKKLSTRGATALLLLSLAFSAMAAPSRQSSDTISGMGDRIIRFILRLPKLFTPTTHEDYPSIPKP
ncbi:MAG: hypothetical protein ABI837_00755 [Acidobacteriota bacterium]